jgi:hypothetical protein
MKSKDIRMAVKNKFGSGDGPAKIFRDLGGAVSLATIKRWIRMLKKTGSIDLSLPPGRTCTPTPTSPTLIPHPLFYSSVCLGSVVFL